MTGNKPKVGIKVEIVGKQLPRSIIVVINSEGNEIKSTQVFPEIQNVHLSNRSNSIPAHGHPNRPCSMLHGAN
jgi:hypothetical protein